MRTFSAGEQDRDNFHLRIARRLADGSLLAVVGQGFGAGSFRFGSDGALLSTATFSSLGILSTAAADALGSVVLVSGGTDYATDLTVMKFDGPTVCPGSCEITVCPFEPTIYSVTVRETNGCLRRGSVELQPFQIELLPRAPLVPARPKPPRRSSAPAR